MTTFEANRTALLVMDFQADILSRLGVLSTVRRGADADYRLFVVKDACADADDEVHRVLTEKVFVRHATVLSTSEVAAALE
jgi:nicotinamidase-related amidase